ncbi:glutathione S-transferase C-terminal-like protein [Boletus reticuloceps]|uniref:Glutathione S-transferase C-terminal-like protein n=1 Tax=Boletus reticuloceps TaxID=495285 RepID=A0A8I2YX96_9AGAM|nr:glutathione S-transferase C-terminal-like protein [Boletus reticuloceps]
MAPIGTLWGKSHQPQTKVILSVAALNGLELELPEYHFFNRPAEYTSKFPYGKIPTFEDSDGFKLFEGETIARYLSGLGTKVNLLGSDAKETALVNQWIHFAEHEVWRPGWNINRMVYGFSGPFNREILDEQKEQLERALTYLETYLATRPSGYLVSDSVRLADLVLAGVILSCSKTTLGAAERAKFRLTFAHYAKVTGDERVKRFWGTEEFTEVTITEPRPFPYS